VYLETLPARAAEAAMRAKAALGDVEWRHAQVACEGIAVNRGDGYGLRAECEFYGADESALAAGASGADGCDGAGVGGVWDGG